MRINKEQSQLTGKKQQDSGDHQRISEHHRRADLHALPNTLRLTGAIILPAISRHGDPQTLEGTDEKHLDPDRGGKSRHAGRAQSIIRALQHNAAYCRDGKLQAHRDAHRQKRPCQTGMEFPVICRFGTKNRELTNHINIAKQGGNALRNHCGDRRAHHTPAKHKNAKQVEKDIQHCRQE